MISNQTVTGDSQSQTYLKQNLGMAGMIALGISFLIWSVILIIGVPSRFSYEFTSSSTMNMLGFASILATILGLILANLGLSEMVGRLRLLTRYSTFFFVWLNVMGIYLLYYGRWNGLSFPGMTQGEFTVISGVIFTLYVFLYSLFLVPFLRKKGLILTTIALLLNEVFLVIVQALSQFVVSHPPATTLPGIGIPYVIQLLNPVFGFPSFQINFTMIIGMSPWVYLLPITANSMLAFLYLSFPVLKRKRATFFVTTKRDTQKHS